MSHQKAFIQSLATWSWRLAAGVFTLHLWAGVPALHAEEEAKIDRYLARVLNSETDKAVPVVVVLKAANLVPATLAAGLNDAQIESYIKQRTIRSQLGLREWVNDHVGVSTLNGEKPLRQYKFFWNANAMMATMTPELIAGVMERDEVLKVYLDRKIKLSYRLNETEVQGEYTYGLEKIGVPTLRSQVPELTGKGVVVGILDTGIEADHPELKGRTIAFKDFVGSGTDPYDDNGHGTHVAGTIGGTGVGGTQIGVAPEVRFVIGKVFTGYGSGSLSSILRGMEWIVNPDGKLETDDKPAVVNNSWGGSMSRRLEDDPFAQAVMTWVQLNIFPSFAAGNSGPSAETIGSPGGLPMSFAVGATDASDGVARFSSRGPVKIEIKGKMETLSKPDVSAPGDKVYSAVPGKKYAAFSGTSMATPHVTGAIALVNQVKPGIKIEDIRKLLQASSKDLGRPGMDHDFGSGRLSLTALIKSLAQFEAQSDE